MSYSVGGQYDRYLAHNEQSTVHKLKETYWTTKQAVIKKLGKKEDEHVVASDSELDAKLEVFKAIQRSSMELLRILEKYQDRLCALSQEENATGRFLKCTAHADKTRAGKISAAVGKSLSFSSQQRLALRVPLVRLYQEVETFRYRAISDTLMTINRMESARTEYRGALLWMKDVSEVLDPDTYKQLEKFRKVQAQVKKTKARFDKLKLDTMQKIDLLAASRCNMFSHVLVNYQTTLLHFWAKTSRTMSAVAESFKGYQYYEFNMLKELCEPTKKLASDTGNKGVDSDGSGSETNDNEVVPSGDDDKSLNEEHPSASSTNDYLRSSSKNSASVSEDSTSDPDLLINFEEKNKQDKEDSGSLNNLLSDDSAKPGNAAEDAFLDFGFDEEKSIDEIKKQQDAEFDLSGEIVKQMEHKKNIKEQKKKEKAKAGEPLDLLSGDIELEEEKDDMALLNEILNAPSAGEDEFTREWQAVFGNTPMGGANNPAPVEGDSGFDYMPSSLLESLNLNSAGGKTQAPSSSQPTKQGAKSKQKKGQKTDMSAWFSLFADLDPLSNPDAIGKNPDEVSDAL